jgi:flagellar M-ring protein FliF
MESMQKPAARMTDRWRTLGPGQRFLVGCVLSGAVLTVFLSVLVVRHVSYSTLFTNLEPEQGNLVVEKLRELKVPYRLTSGGRTVLVPEKDVYTLRLQLASEANPGGSGSGYEIFDRSRFGMTSFMQQVNYRRALEGELARTIREMDEVVSARVHLVIPEHTVFVQEAAQPTASVVVRLKPGARLGGKQIAGISALVAGSVEGLAADRVNILDCYGTLLSSSAQNSGLDPEATTRFEVERQVGEALEERAQSLLDRVVGPQMAVVRVATELDFERLERESELYDPNVTAVRSEQQSEQSAPNSGGESTTSTTNYEISKTIEHVKKAPGSIKRLTVAVTVDGRYEPGAKGSEPRFVPRPASELDKLAALVKNAVGIDDARGDQFHIACVQFDRSAAQETVIEEKSEQRRELMQTVFSRGIIVLAAVFVLVALRLLLGPLLKALGGVPGGATPAPQAPQASGAYAPAAASHADDVVIDVAPVERPRSQVLTGRISEMSRNRPQEAAALIRNMLEEE